MDSVIMMTDSIPINAGTVQVAMARTATGNTPFSTSTDDRTWLDDMLKPEYLQK